MSVAPERARAAAADGTGLAAGAVTVRVRIPVRIDFAGGWTDVHRFSAREGGAVLNAAIDRYVEGRAFVAGERVALEYGSSVPRGSGLGNSAALDVAWLALTNMLMGRVRSAVELAEDAYRLEKLLGVEGGKQDQYAASFGGFNHLEFAAEEEPARVRPLALEERIVRALEDRLVLCYTGSQHHSGSLHERIWARYIEGDAGVTGALREIRQTVDPAREALIWGDLGALAELMTVNREATRRMFAGLVTPTMDHLIRAGERAGAIGSKACGAGGGGCIVFLAAEGCREAVETALQEAGGWILPFRFAPISEWGERAPERRAGEAR